MNLIPIPSESCPHCGIKGKECQMMISEALTIRDFDIKIKEKEYMDWFKGKSAKGTLIREAYFVEKYICLNK